MNILIPACMLLFALSSGADSGDWPMYRADAARSGYTSQRLADGFMLRWSHRADHPPRSAWPTRNRLRFDRAHQPVVSGGLLFYGSSADDKIRALDAVTGEVRWTFCTDGPVRFAPAVWQGRLFVTSDDGHLYCLAAEDGRLLWKRRGGPRADMLLGNDRMISRWPARGGPLVLDGVVYFAAGIWPSEGIYVYAVDPKTGDVLWCNDTCGPIEMDQPHGTARAKSGIAAQGYLVATDETLLVPTGRAVPAALSRSTGELKFFQLQPNQQSGGADVAAIDAFFFNGDAIYATADGSMVGRAGPQVAAHPQLVICSDTRSINVYDRTKLLRDKETVDRKGKKVLVRTLSLPLWSINSLFDVNLAPEMSQATRTPDNVMSSTAWTRPELNGHAAELIVAGDHIVVGGRGQVSVIDIESRALTWAARVNGTASGLAAAKGRLYVSTDQGHLYCFDAVEPGAAADVVADNARSTDAAGHRRDVSPSEPDSLYGTAADEIVQRTGITDGYCLDLGCGDGQLSLELARRTNLHIYAVDEDPDKVRAARQMFDAAGLYGVRVVVHCRDLEKVPYADHFADLVVSGRSVVEGPRAVPAAAVTRQQCPVRGVACLGRPGGMQHSLRPQMEGAGQWTHQNGSPANTRSSDDAIVRGPLEMLWFRDTDLVFPNRHGRGPGPLVHEGLMFVEGLNGLRAQNIYNGRTVWEYPLPGILGAYHREHSIGAAWTGGNYCVSGDRVFVHDGNTCLCLDTGTGRKLAEIQPPRRADGKRGLWGYIACDGDTLFGSLVDEDYLVKCWSDRWDTGGQFTESVMLFALDAETGSLKWTFQPKHSIRHNAIAIGGGRVFLVDRPLAPFDDIRLSETKARSEARRRAAARGTDEEKEFLRLQEHQPGRLLALDQKTGAPLWESKADAFGTLLIYGADRDVLLMGYQAVHQATRDSEPGNRMAAFQGADGKQLWDKQADYADPPVLCGSTVYAPPSAWDLLTGEQLSFALERSYGCGIVVGSERLLLYRSATLGYFDLAGARCTENYGGIRPGCWIAAIPAGGLVLMPDAASWCTCSYLNQASVALQPAKD